jgi:hypothetical protein
MIRRRVLVRVVAGGTTGYFEMRNSQNFRILSICDDDAIRYTRDRLLAEAGFRAEWLPSNAFLSDVQVRKCSVAVICESVDWKRTAQLSATLRRMNPTMHVVRVFSVGPGAESHADAECEIVNGSAGLLGHLGELSGRTKEALVA